MKNIVKYMFLCLFLICNSCINNGELKESELNKIKFSIINDGNKDSYYKLVNYYITEGSGSSIMPYSMIMVYKFNYSTAYFDLFNNTIIINNSDNFGPELIKNLDSNSRKFAIDNLKKSADLGEFIAMEYLAKYYREGVFLDKNIGLAEKLESKLK